VDAPSAGRAAFAAALEAEAEAVAIESAIAAAVELDAAAIIAAVEEAVSDRSGHDLPLTDNQRAILDFERRWWRQPGAKEQAIRENFKISPTRYYQTLNGILDLPEALGYDPVLVHRLLRLRACSPRGRRLT
jgi:hypothetical protein